jgi:DNA repair protein RadC
MSRAVEANLQVFSIRMKPGRTLLEMGAESCSDAELLAILLDSGGRGYSALDSAKALLDQYGTLAGLMNRSLDEVAQVKGASRKCARFGWRPRMKSVKGC